MTPFIKFYLAFAALVIDLKIASFEVTSDMAEVEGKHIETMIRASMKDMEITSADEALKAFLDMAYIVQPEGIAPKIAREDVEAVLDLFRELNPEIWNDAAKYLNLAV